jgi:hypothetical protein
VYETWSLTLREGHRLRVFENWVLRIFGSKRDKVTGELHNEEEIGRACGMNGDKRNAYRVLVGKQEGMEPQGRPRHRRVENIKMDHREKG